MLQLRRPSSDSALDALVHHAVGPSAQGPPGACDRTQQRRDLAALTADGSPMHDHGVT
jgi:hypothetical protein